jgi:hypothetical protein
MKLGSGARNPHAPTGAPSAQPASTHLPSRAEEARASTSDVRESGIVPARARGAHDTLTPAVTLRASRDGVSGFGAAVAGAGDILLVGARLEAQQPFVTLYRVTDEGVVRERLLRGALGHGGPSLATDGERIAVGQPGAEGGLGFVSVYRRSAGELTLETTLEARPEETSAASFGQQLALAGDLLVLGQPASVRVYRHSAVGWLSAGPLCPTPPYEWNPALGQSIGVLRDRVLVGNPVELEGHRAGPGRVFVYRQVDDHMELESELTGDGIEGGREDAPRAGFGACLQVSDDFVLVSAPYELSVSGSPLSRVYLFRSQAGSLTRYASVDVPSCQGGACLIGERLFVLGDKLYVYARAGNQFVPLGSYALAEPSQATLARCGALLAIATRQGAGQVALHFADQT